jgi:RNA binding exosome subunit
MKEYVFQLGRHFYHNISSLDLKIKLLKQSVSPISEQETQTEEQVILDSAHRQLLAEVVEEREQVRGALGEALKSVTVEQNKNAELRQVNKLLQDRLQEGEVRREEEKIADRVTSTQINNSLLAA